MIATQEVAEMDLPGIHRRRTPSPPRWPAGGFAWLLGAVAVAIYVLGFIVYRL
jgi:hypothetical protein